MNINIFYNGTDSNYDKDFKKEGRFIHGEIVSRLGFYAQAIEENQSRVLRIHGVGGSKVDGNLLTNTPGTALGVRMRTDIQSIVRFVMKARNEQKTANLERDDKELKLTVTLTGWSRGGIGCIYSAHMISKAWDSTEEQEYSGIKLDIRVIAFDPVSGLGTNVRALDMSWTETLFLGLQFGLSQDKAQAATESLVKLIGNFTNWWELPEHVTEFHGFYAHDERSIGFATTMPTMLGNPDGRVFKLYEVPGTHSTLVGNLYPNGGADPAEDETPDSVGLHIYRSIVQKAVKLLGDWGVQFDDSIYDGWLEPLGFADNFQLNLLQAPTQKQLEAYKSKAQRVAITTTKSVSVPGLTTDGRGVYIGGNTQDRKWMSNRTLTEFLNEQNTKSFIDSMWQYLVGNETKLNKLGGTVSALDYDLAHSGWA